MEYDATQNHGIFLLGGEASRIVLLGAENPERGLPAVHRPNATWVYVVVCYIRGVALSTMPWAMRTRDRAPPDQEHMLHFHTPRLVALRGGDRNEETPTTENEVGMLMRRASARILSPRSFFAAGAHLAAHTQPALRTGLMAPAWRLLHVSRGVILDLTWR